MRLLSSLLILLLLPSAVLAEETESEEQEIPHYANPYEADCRKKLGLGFGELLPGPQRGNLRRCVNNAASDARRQNRVLKRRRSVTNRREMLHEKVLQKEISKEVEDARTRSRAVRNRLLRQKKPPTSRFLNIREKGRARIDFSTRNDGRAERRSKAAECRKVPASEWATCIREALKTGS